MKTKVDEISYPVDADYKNDSKKILKVLHVEENYDDDDDDDVEIL